MVIIIYNYQYYYYCCCYCHFYFLLVTVAVIVVVRGNCLRLCTQLSRRRSGQMVSAMRFRSRSPVSNLVGISVLCSRVGH